MSLPDIVFIVLDTQRADRLGCYGNTRGLTPNLDTFAAKGARFDRAVSTAQWTIPSHASLFTGLYPTAHQVTQSHNSLSPDHPHIAELVRDKGYETVGFVNNPLVGILNNGFQRGFEQFFNYGGAIPNRPIETKRIPWPLTVVTDPVVRFLRKISIPITNYFSKSDLAFRIAINSWITPIWSRLANFKGQNERSTGDITGFLKRRDAEPTERPLFLFFNLMETHLPFFPPTRFIDQTAPYLMGDPVARGHMRRWNREAYRWAAPLAEPLSDIESNILNDLYDAEVAYQDDYLGQLLAWLEQRPNAENTLTIIVADHGDGIGEHGYMGHAFVAYDELVHVPLILHWPGKISAEAVIDGAVSTRRIFHTIAAAAEARISAESAGLSLLSTINGDDPERETAFAEIYPPLTFVAAVKHRQPQLLTRFRCDSMRRAVVKDGQKLVRVDGKADELFDLSHDPLELEDMLGERSADGAMLDEKIGRFRGQVEAQRDNVIAGDSVDLEDKALLEQLRALGYVE